MPECSTHNVKFSFRESPSVISIFLFFYFLLENKFVPLLCTFTHISFKALNRFSLFHNTLYGDTYFKMNSADFLSEL